MLLELWSNEGKAGVGVSSGSLFQEKLGAHLVSLVPYLQPANYPVQHTTPAQEAVRMGPRETRGWRPEARRQTRALQHQNTNRLQASPVPLTHCSACLPSALDSTWFGVRGTFGIIPCRQLGRILSLFPNKTRTLRLGVSETHSPRSPRRGGDPAPKGA